MNKVYSVTTKAIIKAQAAFQNKYGMPLWLDKWRGLNGKILRQDNISVAVMADGIHMPGPFDAVRLTWTDAKALATRIDGLSLGCDHLSAKNNGTWTTAYQLADRPMPYMNALGALGTKTIATMPCHNCGIVLPYDSIQVDHHMPQANGESLYTLKMLRGLGQTEGAPTGTKGTATQLGNAIGVIQPKVRDTGNMDHMVNPSAAAKWTTNDSGTAFLSLLVYGDYLDDLFAACKNTLLNLAPLCGPCNREKSDWVKPIA